MNSSKCLKMFSPDCIDQLAETSYHLLKVYITTTSVCTLLVGAAGVLIWKRLSRTRFYQRLRSHKYDPDRPTLMCLPDEVLLEILDLFSRPLGTEQQVHLRRTIKFNPQRDRSVLIVLSNVNARLRSLSASSLFNSISIRQDERSLKSLAGSEPAQRHLRLLRVKQPFDSGIGCPWDTPPLLLRKILNNVANSLASLEIDDPPCERRNPHFLRLKSMLPTLDAVESLKVAPRTIWIIRKCPRVKSIGCVTGHDSWWSDTPRFQRYWLTLFESAARCSRLTHFEVELTWRRHILRKLLKLMPEIESLGMRSDRWGETLDSMMPVLARFAKLRTLHLPTPSAMCCERPRGVCGNPYLNETEATRLQRWRQTMRKLEIAADEVFQQQGSVVDIWFFGHNHATVRRDPEGRPVDVHWEYTSQVGCCDYWHPSRTEIFGVQRNRIDILDEDI